MRIGIDGSPLFFSFHSGMRHFSEQFLKNLAKIDQENEYIIFSPQSLKPFGENFRNVIIPQQFPLFKRQILLPLLIQKEHVDLFHYLEPFGAFFMPEVKVVCTVHDMNLEMIYKNLTTPTYQLTKYYKYLLRYGTLKNADICITNSRFTAQELKEYFKKSKSNSPKIIHVPFAAHSAFKVLRLKPAHHEKFFICFGDFSPRKNTLLILQSFSQCQEFLQAGIRLKIVTSTKEQAKLFKQTISQLKLRDFVDILVDVNFAELTELYNQALALLYPSLYEGFGIPILEAMACGCPVITSNYGAMKETSGKAALFVNPNSSEDLKAAMQLLVSQSKVAHQLREKGLEWARGFTWEKNAQTTLEIYKTAVLL